MFKFLGVDPDRSSLITPFMDAMTPNDVLGACKVFETVNEDAEPSLEGLTPNGSDSLLMRPYASTKTYGLVLLCCMFLHIGNGKELEEARALEYLEGPVIRSVVSQNPELRELHMKVIHHLKLYQVGAHLHAHNYAMV